MRVGRVLDNLHMLALPSAIAKFGNRGGGICAEPREIGGIGPSAGDDACTISRSDLRLIGLDNRIERSRIDKALPGQDRFKGPHTERDLGQFGMLVVMIMMVVIMVMVVMVIVVIVVMVRHGREDERMRPRFQQAARVQRAARGIDLGRMPRSNVQHERCISL